MKLIQLHMYQGSPLFPIFRAASTVIPLLTKATFTPSIQPNLGLPRTRPPLTSAINTLLAIRARPFFPHVQPINTLRSALIANSLSIPALLRTYSFLTLSIRYTPTKLLKHFISRTFTFLLSALLVPHAAMPMLPPYNAVCTITTSSRRFLGLYPQSPIAQDTFQRSPSSISFSHLHQLPLATQDT